MKQLVQASKSSVVQGCKRNQAFLDCGGKILTPDLSKLSHATEWIVQQAVISNQSIDPIDFINIWTGAKQIVELSKFIILLHMNPPWTLTQGSNLFKSENGVTITTGDDLFPETLVLLLDVRIDVEPVSYYNRWLLLPHKQFLWQGIGNPCQETMLSHNYLFRATGFNNPYCLCIENAKNPLHFYMPSIITLVVFCLATMFFYFRK